MGNSPVIVNMAYLPLLQTLQQAAGFNQTDADHLTTIQELLAARQAAVSNFLAEQFTFNCIAEQNQRQAAQKIFVAWARNAFLTPCDELYAQRRWLAGLVGLQVGISPQTIAAKLESFYAFTAGQLPKDLGFTYKETLLKSLNVDLAFIGQCYSRNQRLAVDKAVSSTAQLKQAFAAKSTIL